MLVFGWEKRGGCGEMCNSLVKIMRVTMKLESTMQRPSQFGVSKSVVDFIAVRFV
jgi:hypothetical protein